MPPASCTQACAASTITRLPRPRPATGRRLPAGTVKPGPGQAEGSRAPERQPALDTLPGSAADLQRRRYPCRGTTHAIRARTAGTHILVGPSGPSRRQLRCRRQQGADGGRRAGRAGGRGAALGRPCGATFLHPWLPAVSLGSGGACLERQWPCQLPPSPELEAPSLQTVLGPAHHMPPGPASSLAIRRKRLRRGRGGRRPGRAPLAWHGEMPPPGGMPRHFQSTP